MNENDWTYGHCARKKAPGGCQLHNLQCGYPDCDRKRAAAPTPAPVPVDPAELEALRRDAARWQKIETLWFLGDVTLTTDEDAQFIVHVDPAEHASQAWTGIDQCAAIDAALAANGEKGT